MTGEARSALRAAVRLAARGLHNSHPREDAASSASRSGLTARAVSESSETPHGVQEANRETTLQRVAKQPEALFSFRCSPESMFISSLAIEIFMCGVRNSTVTSSFYCQNRNCQDVSGQGPASPRSKGSGLGGRFLGFVWGLPGTCSQLLHCPSWDFPQSLTRGDIPMPNASEVHALMPAFGQKHCAFAGFDAAFC